MGAAFLIFATPPAVTMVLPKAPAVTMVLPTPPAVTMVLSNRAPAVTMILPRPAAVSLLVSISGRGPQGVPGESGPQGVPGPRGSLFLGGYPSFANLPVPDGVNIKPGDFALVQDESTIYELE